MNKDRFCIRSYENSIEMSVYDKSDDARRLARH